MDLSQMINAANAPVTAEPTAPAQQAPAAPAAPAAAPTSLDALMRAAAGSALQASSGDGAETVSIDDNSITSREFVAYKIGDKDVIHRLTILLPSAIKVTRTHYIKDKGYFVCESQFRKEGGFEIPIRQAVCCQSNIPKAKHRCGALVIQWTTDKLGRPYQLPTAKPGEFPFGFELKLWRFNEQTFEQLRTVNGSFPLAKHDVLVKSEDPQYQRCQITPCPESIADTPQFIQAVGPTLQAWIAAKATKIGGEIATRISEQEWMQMLATIPGATAGAASFAGNLQPAAGAAPPQSIADLLNNIGGPQS